MERKPLMQNKTEVEKQVRDNSNPHTPALSLPFSTRVIHYGSHFWSTPNTKPINTQRKTMTHFFSYTQGAWWQWRVSIRQTVFIEMTARLRSLAFQLSSFSCKSHKHSLEMGPIRGGCLPVIIKDSNVVAAGGEMVGFGGIVVRQTPTLFVNAWVSVCVCVRVSENVCRFPREALAERYLFKPLGWTDGASG